MTDGPAFSELLAALAARTPAPAGGCASAWTAALAAALLEMVGQFAERSDVAARGTELRAALLRAAQDDERAYLPVLEAMRLPREQADRSQRVRSALAVAAQPPLAVAEAAAEIAALAASVRPALRVAVREDAVTCVLLADAATRTAARLVLANVDGQEAAAVRQRVAAALSGAASAVASATH